MIHILKLITGRILCKKSANSHVWTYVYRVEIKWNKNFLSSIYRSKRWIELCLMTDRSPSCWCGLSHADFHDQTSRIKTKLSCIEAMALARHHTVCLLIKSTPGFCPLLWFSVCSHRNAVENLPPLEKSTPWIVRLPLFIFKYSTRMFTEAALGWCHEIK